MRTSSGRVRNHLSLHTGNYSFSRLSKCLNIIQATWEVSLSILAFEEVCMFVDVLGTMRLGRRSTHFVTEESVVSEYLLR